MNSALLLVFTPRGGGRPIEGSVWAEGVSGCRYVIPLDGGPRRIVCVRGGLNKETGGWDWHEADPPAPRRPSRRRAKPADEDWEQLTLDLAVTR